MAKTDSRIGFHSSLRSNETPNPFEVKDCALIGLATGRKAQNLRELRDHLLGVSAESVYFHFWGGLLLPRFEEREYNNDFAAWAHHSLHDESLAERLAVIDPTEYANIDFLRREVVEVIEQRLDELEQAPWSKSDRKFEFLQSKIVVFDTGKVINRPESLPSETSSLTPSSVFFHFIDAKRRHPEGMDDFSSWLVGFGDDYAPLRASLESIDPYFISLVSLRERIAHLFSQYFRENDNES